MMIKLNITPDQHAWIADAIARGEFATEEEAAQAAFDLGVLQCQLEDGEETEEDIAHLRGLLDEARAQVARGEVFTAEDVKASMAELLARHKK